MRPLRLLRYGNSRMKRAGKRLRSQALLRATPAALAALIVVTSHRTAAEELPGVRVENIEVEKADDQVEVVAASRGKTTHTVPELDAPPGRAIGLRDAARPDSARDQLISLKLQHVSLEHALKALTKKTGLNFLMSAGLAGLRLNVYLRGVPAEGALLTILKANGLWYERQKGTNIYVVTKGPQPAEVATEIIRCGYASVADLGNIVENNLTSNGSFTVDKGTNSVVVSDTPSNVARLRRILSELDQPSKQVLIEVKIVEVDLAAARELGISWDWTGKVGKDSPVGSTALRSSFNTATEGILSFSIGRYASNVGVRDLQTAITALEKEGRADLLASPKILTLDGRPASIKITERIALARKVTYQGAVGGPLSIEEPIFGDVGVMLTVTSHVLNERMTILDVKPTVSSARKSIVFS